MDVALAHIRSFVTVARLKSFTRAAKLLHLSQPALTVQIRRLEETLSARLLDRTSRSVELTRTGAEALPGFEKLLQDIETLVHDLRGGSTRQRGTVRLAALPSIASGLLPDAIQSFRSDKPNVYFALRDVVAKQVLDLVRNEDVDFGVAGDEVAQPGIEVIFSLQDQMHVIYPSRHRIGREAMVTPEHLAQYPLIMMASDTSVRAVVERAFHQRGLIPHPACEATYMMTAVAMVRAGLGLAILPGSAREIRAERDVRSRPIDDPAFARRLSVIKRAGRTLPPLSEAFAKHLIGELKTSLNHRKIKTHTGRAKTSKPSGE
ncbi:MULTISPECIES: LysR family transcriptional regulator [unclassified Bradyrhizobium]|uniref:LysR family transcriptional regulator n=1 Tax=unclassified Bradyrhizobium TaxID=2631580 RepID=UPI0028EC4CA5|nr:MULTISPECIES: LysR family transcriptional regulator [unclassified Bradyrhizobium]